MVGLITHVFSATQAEATSNSAGAATTWVGPNEWNSAHKFAVTLTGSTSNVSTISGTNIILGASQNLTVSGTSNSVYLMGPQLSAWTFGEGTMTSFDATSLGATSADIFGGMFILPTELAMQRIDFYGSMALSAAANTVSTSSSSAISTTGQTWINAGLFSRGGGTSTGTLYLMSSAQLELAYSASNSNTSTSYSNTLSVTWSSGVPQTSTSSTYSGTEHGTTAASQATGLTSGSTGAWTGAFDLPMPFAGTLEPGEYFVGLQIVTSGSNVAGPRLTFFFNKQASTSSQAALTFGYLGGKNTAATPPSMDYAMGLMMTNGASNSMATSYPMSSLLPNSLGVPLIQLANWGTNTSFL